MHPVALALALAAALVHAAWNLLAKRSGDQLLFLWLIFATAAVLGLPLTIGLLGSGELAGSAGLLLLTSTLAHALYAYSLGAGYRLGDLSLVYPMSRGLGLTLVPIGGWLLLGERLAPIGIFGIALIAAGIVFIGGLAVVAQRRGLLIPRRQFAWIAVCGTAIASYSLLDHEAVRHFTPLPYLATILLGCCLWLSPAVYVRRAAAIALLRKQWPWIVGAALASTLGYALVLYAFRLSETGYVVAARESSVLIAVLLGGLLLGEGQLRLRLAGAGAVVAGLVCLALAG